MSAIILQIMPLYMLIALGFVAGRYYDVNLHSIARLCVFIFTPFVFWGALVQLEIQSEYIALPFITSLSSFTITLSALWIGKKIWNDATPYAISCASVNANAIYFGAPIIQALFGVEALALYIFMNLGGAINNLSLGYYISARGRLTTREAINKLVRFPAVYAMIAGLSMNLAGYELSPLVEQYWRYALGALVLLGMMMIGVSVSKLNKLEIKWSELAALFIMKYIAWPSFLGGFAWLDYTFFQLFNGQIYAVMMTLSVMPLFANFVSYSAENNLFPQRAGSAVVLSSLFSVITIPAVIWLIQYLDLALEH